MVALPISATTPNDGQSQDKFFDNKRTVSMEGFCLDHFRKTVNVRNFCEYGGEYVHQSNDTVRDFHLHLSDSKQYHSTTTTAHLHKLLDRMSEKK